MKAKYLPLAYFTLIHVAATQPHQPLWRRLTHRHNAKRAESSCPTDAAIVTTIATATESVTYNFEDVIVYVDDEGRAVSTTTVYRNLVSATQAPASTSTPVAPVLSSSKSPTPPQPQAASAPPPSSSTPAPTPAPNPKQAAPPSQSSQSETVPPAAPSSSPSISTTTSNEGDNGEKAGGSSGPGFGSAISYTPYNSDNSCKSSAQVATDLGHVSDYEVIRLYGVDCNQVANVIAVTKGKVKLFLGIFDIDSIPSSVQTMSSALNGNWGLVNAVNVGNELINSGKASAGQVTAAIGTARTALKAAGYNGPVVTVDTMIAMKNNPSLCEASDFCAINCHAFFDGNVEPSGAGKFVKDWAQQVSQAAGGKTVVVTESGWPHQGGSNGAAIASPENHQAAISSLKASFGGGTNLILYGMYNDLWKKDGPDTHGAEKYWGIYGDAPS